MSTIVWFRQDLRLDDNPAWRAAIERGQPIIPVFIWDPASEGDWAPGGASRWWLHHALNDLISQLAPLKLTIRIGHSEAELAELCHSAGSTAVYWNRRYEPALIEADRKIRQRLAKRKITFETFNAALLFEPEAISNQSGKPFRVFTPFWRHCLSRPFGRPEPKSMRKPLHPRHWPESVPLEELNLLPGIRWDRQFYATWNPTRKGALNALDTFLERKAQRYPDARDRPDIDGTSRLSPYLHFGQIGPREILAAVNADKARPGTHERFVAEIGWREFAHHLLHHFPDTTTNPLRPEFNNFPWRSDEETLEAWRQGKTGYPIVDAGMRQLWAVGWMHNRVRMIAGSFLVKHLLQPWQEGARWFWDTLVDADLASNTLGWQWVAGSGADASPYFRIFNPITQGEKFDPHGDYIRTWVPELAGLKPPAIHRPWDAEPMELASAGVRLGDSYPEPIVSHFAARGRALEAYERVKQAAG